MNGSGLWPTFHPTYFRTLLHSTQSVDVYAEWKSVVGCKVAHTPLSRCQSEDGVVESIPFGVGTLEYASCNPIIALLFLASALPLCTESDGVEYCV